MVDFEYDEKRAMKQKDFKPCAHCGEGVLHQGVPVFIRVTIETMGVDLSAVKRQAGLELMLNPTLAAVMGPDADMGIPMGEPQVALLCTDCVAKGVDVAILQEKLNRE